MLDSLVPALQKGKRCSPDHIVAVDPNGIEHVNVRSTVATYSGVLDDLRRSYARLEAAKTARLTAGDISYNTGSLRCPGCQGTGEITLDVQFLPDVEIPCTECNGRRRRTDIAGSAGTDRDRKSTRLNSSHVSISYA